MATEAESPGPALQTACCIVGGGPAGMMLGYLLARQGIEVVVVEKHGDFLRDFRGDTVHPSTLDALESLGLLDDFLAIPHTRLTRFAVQVGGETLPGPDLRFITAHNKYLVLMPQWDFLNFLAERAKRFPSFHVMMNAECTDLVRDGWRVTGVKVATEQGERIVLADLVVGCDGRRSTVREKAGLPIRDLGAPIDVLWMRLERRPDDPPQTFGSIELGHFMVLLDRTTYWQCAYVIPKGAFDEIRGRGIEAFHDDVRAGAPFLGDRMNVLTWDDVKLLSVSVDRLRTWATPGLLCIGDAAHAMSPVGGVGINLAIQDAIATSNILGSALRERRLSMADLRRIQRRRQFAVRITQAAQVRAHRRFLAPALARTDPSSLDAIKRGIRTFGFLRYLLAQFVGVGVRPERPDPVT
jgi:2-polyprenyl-6-methoxyphenol hydroxylase-like FAD-dependent oxidoreductase